MTPEGKVKAWGRGRLHKYLPGHISLMPQGGSFGAANGLPDWLGFYQGVPLAIEYKADETKDPTPLQRFRLKKLSEAGFICAVIRGKDEYRMRLLCELVRKRAELIAPIIAAESEPENANQSGVTPDESGV